MAELKMTPEQIAWLEASESLARAGNFNAVVEHLRENVNFTKEILLSTDPTVQREIHEIRCKARSGQPG